MTKIQRAIVAVAAAGGLCWASAASAQIIPINGLPNTDPAAANAAFPLQNPQGPGGSNYQVNYPYPGQCLADPANKAIFPALFASATGACAATASSFSCDSTTSISQRTAGGWAACNVVTKFKDLAPLAPLPYPPAVFATAPLPVKFQWEVLNPPDYTPDVTTYPGADYYELGLHEAWGFQAIAGAGLFPNPLATVGGVPAFPGGVAVPDGMQWTGLLCNNPAGCACPADINPANVQGYCAGGSVAFNSPLFTPVWGVGQINNLGGPVTKVLALPAGTPSSWSKNNYVATWPSISVRANKGTPVVVKWTNEFPNTHVLCPHPDAADWPCAIDRTFMGVKARIDPALAPLGFAADVVGRYGSPQQPDNSWVTHLHGGEIPPSTDGFAEKWFGNINTAAAYNGVAQNLVSPPFEAPLTSNITLSRPAGKNADTYTYPMVQEEATIWFHDHTLGKTHHNVIAGPAGFFPVKEPLKHGSSTPTTVATTVAPGWYSPRVAIASGGAAATCPPGVVTCTNDYTWLDPVTEPRDGLGIPKYDLFLAIQDRAFNEDGSFNFSNGLGQTPPAAAVVPIAGTAACAQLGVGGVCQAGGTTSVTAGVNPLVHPVWVPEYFGDHALVNGVLWPKKTVEPGWYRLRIVDGSDSRCYTLGLQVVLPGGIVPIPGGPVAPNQPFYVIANDQGYLKNPVRATSFTMCPGERYEILVNFGALTGSAANGSAQVYMTNSAVAPFPVGIAPTVPGPFQDLNLIMMFDVKGTGAPADPARPGVTLANTGVKSCALTPTTVPRAGVGGVIPWPKPYLVWNAAQDMRLAANAWTPALIPSTAGNLAQDATGAYTNICMPANPALMTDASFVDMHLAAPVAVAGTLTPLPIPTGAIIRQVYLNEKVDGVTLFPLGMQLNGVPFEYKVTETPKQGTTEYWMFINLTVDAHPMHPHLVRHQLVSRQNFSVARYKAALCGSTTCQPGTAPGGEMQVVPDVTAPAIPAVAGTPVTTRQYLTGNPTMITAAQVEGGYKDVTRVMPNQVTTIVAKWDARWAPTVAAGAVPTAPSGVTCGDALGATPCPVGTAVAPAAGFTYEDVTRGPYVWHCHINSHEDSEMMRTSLVVK